MNLKTYRARSMAAALAEVGGVVWREQTGFDNPILAAAHINP